MNEGGEIVGMVDVLKLTYATLEQVRLMRSLTHQGDLLTALDQHHGNWRERGASLEQILAIDGQRVGVNGF
jgi:hypothetical protein